MRPTFAVRRRHPTLFRLSYVVVAFLLAVLPPSTTVAGPTAGGIASDNLDYIGHVPFDIGTATGARLVGHHLYVTSFRALSIYDVRRPLDPRLVSTTPIGLKYQNEDVATDGRILLFSESSPSDVLHVWDVEDKSNPREIAQLSGAGDHTMSCILRCQWGYGSDGAIVDLRDPTRPRLVGDWTENVGLRNGSHDVEEFRDGFVLAASYSEPFLLLDVRRPTSPKILASGPAPGGRGWWYHAAAWPRRGRDSFVIMEAEGTAAPIMSFDARTWRETRSFTQIDSYAVGDDGNYLNGRSPQKGESSHWFDVHPNFREGGLIAVAWYSHGTRIVRLTKAGKFSEVGYFLPYGGITYAAYWVGDDVIYSIDHTRGIDILRLNP